MVQERCQAGRAGTLDQGFLDLEQHHDGLLDVALVDQQEVIHQTGDDLLRQPTRRAHRNALGQGALALRMPAACDRIGHGRKLAHLNPHQLDVGAQRLGRCGHAGHQPAAPHGHHQRVDVRLIGQHLQRDRALPGDDGLVVIGVHQHQRLLLGQRQRVGACLLERVAVQDDLRTKAACAFDLDPRCEAGHDDHRPHPEALRVIGHALGVVASAHGHHPAAAFVGAQ